MMNRKLQIPERFRKKVGVDYLSISGFDTGAVAAELDTTQRYELHIQSVLGNILTKDDVFLDIGANVGMHTVFASKFAKEVIAIEPSEKTFEHLLKTVEINNCDNVSCHNIGLWDKDETRLFYHLPKSAGSSHFTIDYHESNAIKNDVEVRRLDNLELPHIDVVKLDVEGVEKFVLKGGKKLFNECPTLFIELNPSACQNHTGENIMATIHQIMSFGYSTEAIYYARRWKSNTTPGYTWERTNLGGLIKELSLTCHTDVIFMTDEKIVPFPSPRRFLNCFTARHPYKKLERKNDE